MSAGMGPRLALPLSPQVSSLVQTLRARDAPLLQPQRWLGSWVRQVWGAAVGTGQGVALVRAGAEPWHWCSGSYLPAPLGLTSCVCPSR